jgi:hypothetical protein
MPLHEGGRCVIEREIPRERDNEWEGERRFVIS